MKHINTIKTRDLCESAKNGGCGVPSPSVRCFEDLSVEFLTKKQQIRLHI